MYVTRLIGKSLLLLLILGTPTLGATLEGTIYDYSLTKVDQAIVEISSIPLQRHITINGRYTFDVPPGNYTLTAQAIRRNTPIANITQRVSIIAEGKYTLDLILLPILEIHDEPFEDIEIETIFPPQPQEDQKPNSNQDWTLITAIMAFIIVAIVFLPHFSNKKKQPGHMPPEQVILSNNLEIQPPFFENEKNTPTPISSQRPDINQLINLLNEHEGRATQRDLRKGLPYSEAKTSLILTELEALGRIKKIRKGRGNIIILQETRLEEKK